MAWEIRDLDKATAGHADWELAAARARKKEDLLLPVYVRLTPAAGGSADEVIGRLNELRGQVFVADHEMDLLRTQLEADAADRDEVNLFLLCRPDAIHSDLWTVLHVGAPIEVPPELPKPYAGANLGPPASLSAGPPMVAVIDDAIGYLNARFRRNPASTRFDAVWIMGQDQPPAPLVPPAGAAVYTGAILTGAQIGTELASGRSEGSLYYARNEAIFAPADHKGTNLRGGHGTCVLDLAAGDEPGGGLADVGLLAVQLPPAAIVATSGRRLEHLVLQGLRWIIARALRAAILSGRRMPLIVNLSLGTLAGPRDKTEILAARIPGLIGLFRLLSLGTPMRVVAAYGNAFRDRLTARSTVAKDDRLSFDWRVLPDDRTASYLEIRVGPGRGDHIALTLTPPGGIPALVLPKFLTTAQKAVYEIGGEIAAGVYRLSETHHDMLLVVVAPTETDGVGVTAPPGAWRVDLANRADPPVDMLIQVQRDDTPDGYRIRGRQAWLDHRDGWTWDGETMDWTFPNASACPVTREDTAASFCAMDDRSTYLVGAMMPDRAVPDGVRPSLYAAQGEPARHTGPALSARADDGRALTGRRASGVQSGSRIRLSGSSAAAPIVTRALAGLVLSGHSLPANPTPADRLAEMAQLLGVMAGALPVWPDSRSGFGTVQG
ncbi:MAG: hypothetical protein JSR87_14955 [Proteobacteria bacterium]|nr:hypothetical protein [Pseudomonadota bacterium]MBS0572923.1 hypothetical protein [Pseudomonadota bacterium]